MRRVLMLLIILVVAVAPMAVMAQEPGSGGTIVEGSGGTSIGSLNAIRCSGTDCSRITGFLYTGLLGTDPETQNLAVTDGSLASDYSVSEDGLTYTFDLKDNLVWSDGEPMDGFDYLFSYEAIMSGQTETQLQSYLDGRLTDVQVSEDGQQLTLTFASAACDNLTLATYPTLMPSHYYGWEPGSDFDFSVMVEDEFNTAPPVTSGPFVFSDMASGERVVLEYNPNYYTTVVPEGFLYVNVPDQTVLVERFLQGELNVIDEPQAAQREAIRNDEGVVTFEYAGRSWDYVGLNLANPDNPQNGVELDEEGNVVRDENGLPVIVEQEPHPLFGDVRVRQAMQLAINVEEIIEKATLGEGTQMAANELPTSWALNPDLAPVPYDPEAASALLAEAGFEMGDDGVLVATEDAMYAEAGTRFSFELITNEGNTRRGQVGELVQDQLAQVGIEVEFTAIDFNQLLEIMDAQEFDAIILGWRNGYPVDPDQTGLFTSDADIVGSGFNFVSYTNPELDALMQDARTVEGCSFEDRAAIYHQIQEILQADQPYLWLYAQNGMYAAQESVQGFGPYPNEMYWNVETWDVQSQ